ncbi:urea ABC transporter substrate-binding protein [Trinickia acidisoli]|uniref:urea ABC transporter substrate-binding protein n=1 Tax=Trinickia acidisoli TaxID=2767482 RepID=UPI001A8F2BAF|nr:ABC transporter substrate-binding protein [Trinickia acidisoli]
MNRFFSSSRLRCAVIARACAVLVLLFVGVMRPAMADDAIPVGAIFDLTGGLNIYGIQQSRALHLAVDDVNKHGGVLGHQIKIVEADAQSEQSKYTQYANTLIMRDRVVALFAGLTSAAREAIRPVVRAYRIPYFYTSLYEGGACDRFTFVTGPSASQQLSVLIKWAVAQYGKRIYVMAPDYNFGTISAQWIDRYAKANGATVAGVEFLPLTLSDFGPTLQKIQAARPNFVVALPVGANQTGFVEQFAAAGLKHSIALVSTNYGSGNQQVVVSPAASAGVVSALEYFDALDTPENAAFKALWHKTYGNTEPVLGVAVNTWNALHLWAQAVSKAGSTDPDKTIAALQSGIGFDGPNGEVTLEPGSHHVRENIYIVRADLKRGFQLVQSHTAVAPVYENETCDLIHHPATATQFTPARNP